MRTAFFSHPDCLLHEMGSWHPESPARLQAIEDQVAASGIAGLLERREAPLAGEQALLRVHSAQAVARIREQVRALQESGEAYYPLDGDTMLNANSWQAALRAAGAALAATDAVLAGEVRNAFCSVRPPGHHARPSESMGFCLFGNVAVAARHALDARGLERVAVVDFDVHHGNGTAEAFLDDPRVLMVSFFQHPFYPYTEPENAPNMVNLPVPAFAGGAEVRPLIEKHWLPALHAHRPQMIFISAGFDAHKEDDIGQLGLVEEDFAWITRRIMEVADEHAQGRIVSCLEGGYNLSALGRSVVAHLKALAKLE
ncbi:histone deacetylase family protein [Noviherbaspirillum aridicola]|uniref:Histone deacetylase n=1 Tax=Noviherbaspirillum aridicola TaxID=2849687 RepID=A0ABQ4Q4K7_9BURK|nr:histone deacetylase family protein [Noviherbaspirillum aridicola]GIZ51941.1 histone deacetylase [Noviherbaspirillum aridicola]